MSDDLSEPELERALNYLRSHGGDFEAARSYALGHPGAPELYERPRPWQPDPFPEAGAAVLDAALPIVRRNGCSWDDALARLAGLKPN